MSIVINRQTVYNSPHKQARDAARRQTYLRRKTIIEISDLLEASACQSQIASNPIINVSY